MPEEQKSGAQSSLGQLFVEFGTKGLPNLIKNLNAVSATFLLTKNAAEQFTKPLREIYKEAGNTAIGVGKMSAMLGASMKDVYKLQKYFEEKNVDSSSMISGINSMMNIIYDLRHGLGGIDGKMNTAFSNLGINIWEYNEGLEGTLELYEDIQKATKNLSAVDRNAYLRLLSLPPETAYLFERGEFNKSDALSLSDVEVERLIAREEAKQRRDLAFKNIGETISSAVSPVMTIVNNKTADAVIENKEGIIEGTANTGKVVGQAALSTPIGKAALIGGIFALSTNKIKQSIQDNTKQQVDGRPTGFASSILDLSYPPTQPNVPISGLESGVLPPNMNELHNSITNNNTFNISGSNANEIADKVVSELDVQSLRYNQFQLENPPMR